MTTQLDPTCPNGTPSVAAANPSMATGETDEEAKLVTKKRKIDVDEEGERPLSFLLASDLTLLTDYFILLFSQVTRGVMNESDLQRAKKNRPCDQLGFFGICCRHCLGVEKGKYFPSCAKNLCATPPTLHSHLLVCPSVPEEIRRALRLTKSRHKFAAMTKPSGSQSVFFRNMWERIQSTTFTGDDSNGLATIQTEIDFIIEQSKPKPKLDPKVQRALNIARQHEPAMVHGGNQPTQAELPNVVSYDVDIDDNNYAFAAQALDVELKETTVEPPTEEDFELVLELLMQPETPENESSNNFLQQSPSMAFAMTPTAVPLLTPIPTRVNSFGERYHNGEFVISSTYDATNYCDEEAMKKTEEEDEEEFEAEYISPRPNDETLTRKFTRADEILLVRGILKYGKSQWKKIWQETRQLQHIKHSALKDRARSNRFKSILERAQADPSLLDQPQELCGDEDGAAYHTPRTSTPGSATPRSATPKSSTPRTSTPRGRKKGSAVADPLSSCGPLRRR